MPPKRRSSEQNEERHLWQQRRQGRRVPTQSRPRPLVGQQLRRSQSGARPLHRQVQPLQGLLPIELLRLVELQLLRTRNEEARARILANKVRENERRRAFRQSRRAWNEAGFNRPIRREGIARVCQCEPGTFQPNCREQSTCPTTRRPVRLHFAPGADYGMARVMYFATGDELYPGMYEISGDEWEHDSGDESNSNLPLS